MIRVGLLRLLNFQSLVNVKAPTQKIKNHQTIKTPFSSVVNTSLM